MSFKDIDIDTFREKMICKKSIVIDIRDPDSFAYSNIPGSKNFTSDDLMSLINNEDKEKELLIYCYKGNSSRKVAHFLSESGFSNVYSLIGGFNAWEHDK
tara:strand:- start:213 stop:512 length:300 start_codon:yes stop_codon:yes gene_type:complete